ncbi:MAG: hypothetical protein ACOX3R_16315 [Desulfitobacteriia bacterium]
MKRLFIFVVTLLLLLVFSIAACGKSETADTSPQGNEIAGQEETTQIEQPSQQEQTEQSKVSDGIDSGQKMVYQSFDAFKESRKRFEDYVVDQNHEIVGPGLPTVSVFDANIFDYVLPLDFIGRSVELTGKFDIATENQMLKKAWAEDAQLTYDETTGYQLTGTKAQGNKLEIKIKFDAKADSLRLEAYKDGALDLLFEYVAIDGGYAAQHYLEDTVGQKEFTPIMALCTHKLIFGGTDGSKARYDDVAEPASILGSPPDPESFIDGATHWFTVKKGQFSGNINGIAF